MSISDVQLSYSASQTLVDEGSATSQVASEAVLGSTASSSLARTASSVASRSALLDFSDVSITSRTGASASSSGSASHLASASSVNNGGVIAVEDDNERSTASFKSTTAPTPKTSASDYKLTGPSLSK